MHQGFSLVEVLVSILMIATFLAIAMQTLMAATAIKVKSEEISEATAWMQDDLEAIKYEANRLPSIEGNCGNYAQVLQNEINSVIAVSNPRVNASGGREYLLSRQFSTQNDLLGITHEIHRDFDGDGAQDGEPIGQLYSEIIPDAAFACSSSS